MTTLYQFLMMQGIPKPLAYKYEHDFTLGYDIPEEILKLISSYFFDYLKPFMEDRIHDYYVSYADAKGLL